MPPSCRNKSYRYSNMQTAVFQQLVHPSVLQGMGVLYPLSYVDDTTEAIFNYIRPDGIYIDSVIIDSSGVITYETNELPNRINIPLRIVNVLPDVGNENVFYLVRTTDGAKDNIFNEYIWVNDTWEKIGSTAVAVDLTDYVKNTDYPTSSRTGVIAVGEGVAVSSSTGKLSIDKAMQFMRQ